VEILEKIDEQKVKIKKIKSNLIKLIIMNPFAKPFENEIPVK